MAGKQVSGDGLPPNIAGMSKNQLYDIMSQMKTLIEQNKQQARQILIQNPALTRALFQAQIMLGMVQPPQAAPSPAIPQPSAIPKQQPDIQTTSSFPGQIAQNQIRKQQTNQPTVSNSQSQLTPPPNSQPPSKPSHLSQPIQQPKGHIGPQQSAPMSLPQLSQVPGLNQLPQHTSSQHQPTIPSLPSQLQQPSLHQPPIQSQPPLQSSGGQYLPVQQPLQPPLPPQPRPQAQGFPHQGHAQMGQGFGFQHPAGPQMHHSQHMFHSGGKPPTGVGPSFQQGQGQGQLPPQNQLLPPSLYQGQAGNPHMGMDYNQGGSSKQTDRGSNWMPESTAGQFQGQPPSFGGQAGPSSQPPRPPPLTPELEQALLQQVMSLTPDQINKLPTEQRNQILQLRQMLRQ
ncbi:hypothetical protein ABFS82_09G104200 [Erythranthe guttata]|uniref:Cleavage stimulation factor subunit 2 hinge domain-containing protein n=1 Tax=Erythranthe guttata TaxID=4155 RepID=A0A022Q4V0_ERYGU|nr:PREDICTED: cleavage stimulating factor 64 [Erythranthe guttata]EYU21530.1 hypothetical protein MIMGU_mgv1a007714mg [Erythranthe guttata]|eukprot:XP_012856335.1 PREDICTED: cleavage stimulating factor 64 [Erythranthe guttata]